MQWHGLTQVLGGMLKIIAFVVLALAAFDGFATECRPPLFTEDAQAAKTVFVFQVVSAEYRRGSESPLGDFVIATLQVVDPLRGKATATHMSYYIAPGCGPKIQLGYFYAAFLPNESPSFMGSASNLVFVGQTYVPAQDRARLERVMHGHPDAEKALSISRTWLSQIPPPPPPCPGQGARPAP